MSNIEVIGLGALNLDHIYKVKRILGDGEAVVNRALLSPGGSAANTIYGLAKLGATTGFAGAVGDDAEGELLIRDFQKVGVDTRQIKVKHRAQTGSVLCLSDKRGRRSLYVIPGANSRLTIDDIDLNYINQAKILHLSSFADDRQFEMILKLINKLDPTVEISFAPGGLYAAKGLIALAPIMGKTNVLFLNKSELQQLTGDKNIRTGAEGCLKQGSRVVVVTLGKGMALELTEGSRAQAICYIKDAGTEYVIESRNIIRQIDTTGAGDGFAAGFLYGLLDNKDLTQCGQLGDVMARSSIGKLGARQGFPTLAQLYQRYQELYPEQY